MKEGRPEMLRPNTNRSVANATITPLVRVSCPEEVTDAWCKAESFLHTIRGSCANMDRKT